MPPVAAQKRFQKLKYIGIGQRLSREKWLKIQKRCMNHIRRTSDTWSKDIGLYNIVVEAWCCEICDSCNNLWSRHKLCTIYPLPRLWVSCDVDWDLAGGMVIRQIQGRLDKPVTDIRIPYYS